MYNPFPTVVLMVLALLHNFQPAMRLNATNIEHEVLDFHTGGKKNPRALGVWPAHESGHIMSVGTRGNYVWALGAHR